jgi:hypothetical protein
VVLLALGGAWAWSWFRDDGPSHPDEWDPLVADLAVWVEDARGLEFEHPVHVEFLSDEEFEAEVTSDEGELSDDELTDVQEYGGMFRALALVEGEFDLLDAQNQASAGGVLAFYDGGEQRAVVRAPEGGIDGLTSAADLPTDLRVTLAHELTHALQDQHFDIGRFDEETEAEESGEVDLEVNALRETYRALLEGDADRIEDVYIEELSEDEHQEYLSAQVDQMGDYAELQNDVPASILAFQGAPYLLGRAFLDFVATVDGEAGIDAALRDPPRSVEQLFHPFRYHDGEGPLEMELPDPAESEVVVDEGQFGSTAWYLMLASQIDAQDALAAVDGWGGDAYQFIVDGEKRCARLWFRGDSTAETDEMAEALRQWQAALPDAISVVQRDGDLLELETCDPGPDAELGVHPRLDELLAIPVARTNLAIVVLEDADDPDAAALRQVECVAREVYGRLTVEEALAGDSLPVDRVRAVYEAASAAC